MLTDSEVITQAQLLKGFHTAERQRLDKIRRYWKGRQKLPTVISPNAPRPVREMARIARVNICSIVVDTLAQSMFVDGFRGKDDEDNNAVWAAWQANRWDKRQTAIHRAAFAYGAAYAVVTPGVKDGKPMPVMRGVSPRAMTAVYGDDPDWPVAALERRGAKSWRLYDDEAIYELQQLNNDRFVLLDTSPHGLTVTPVVRYLDEEDLDCDDDVPADGTMGHADVPMRGQVPPLMSIQDQIDLTTFGLLVAQWFSAFRQRYAIGWVSDDEEQAAKATAAQLWQIDEDPADVKLGEFSQTDLGGYIESREASMRHGAALSQTPVHELIGELVNLSAEALAAAEKGHDRKVDERKSGIGESHEQTLWLAGKVMGIDVPDDAEVVWRDTSARAFAATIDALGKMVQMLGVPPEQLWGRVPGVTQQDVERWKVAAESGDAFANLTKMLDAQGAPHATLVPGDGSPESVRPGQGGSPPL